ncbi:MAG: FxLYD domain-containing protein [Bacteroidota bacterium]
MKHIPLLFLLLALGCADTEENASTNLRKGDEFYNKGEYEIAEYYYDKIPEESVLKKAVARRIEEINKIKIDPSLDKHSTKKKEGVFITNHTFELGTMGLLPLHKMTIVNNTDKNLQFCELEFVYYDAAGKEVERLSTVATTGVQKQSQKSFEKITPGVVKQKFSKANVILAKPVFF